MHLNMPYRIIVLYYSIVNSYIQKRQQYRKAKAAPASRVIQVRLEAARAPELETLTDFLQRIGQKKKKKRHSSAQKK